MAISHLTDHERFPRSAEIASNQRFDRRLSPSHAGLTMVLRHAATTLFVAIVSAACGAPAKVTAPTVPTHAEAANASSSPLPSLSPSLDADDTEPDDGPRTRPPAPEIRDRAAALAAVRTGQPDAAITFLRGHLDTQPDDLEARLALSRAQVATGQLEPAATTLATLNVAAMTPAVWDRRADIERRRGEPARVEQLLRDGSTRHPDDLGLRGALLAHLAATGRRNSTEAVQLREHLYDAYDNGQAQSPDALLAVARATLARGTGGGFHDANMVLGDAAAAEPVSTGTALADEIALLHAGVFLEKYATDEAAASLAQILDRDPWHPDALALAAKVASTNLQLARAETAALEVLQVDPGHPDAHAVLAHVELVEGRHESAVARIETHVLTRHRDHGDGLAVLAAAAIARDDQAAYARARDRAMAARPDDARFFTLAGELLNVLHLYPEALALAREGVDRLGDDPYAQSSYAIAALQLGDETNGRAALERAWKRDRFNERTFNVRKLFRDTIDSKYVDVDDAKVSIRLPREHHELVVPHVREAARRAKAALDHRYGIDPGKLRLEVFADPDDFAIRTVGVPSLGALGVCFGPVITLVGPYHGTHNFAQVVWHELAHTYAIELSRGRVPRWFTEGLSEWESFVADASWARENAALVRRAKGRGELRPMAELELAFLRAKSPMAMELAYTQAAYAVRFLGESYGHAAIVAALRGFGQGHNTATVFQTAFGRSIADLDVAFGQWLDTALGDTGWIPDPATAKRRNDVPRHELYAQAAAAVSRGDQASARKHIDALLEQADGFAVRMLAAQLEMVTKQWAPAQTHLQAAMRFDPLAAEPWVGSVQIATSTEDADAERAALLGWLRIDAMSLGPAARLLTLAVLAGDTEATAFALRRVQAIAPLDPHALAGAVLVNGNDRSRASVHLGLVEAAAGDTSPSVAALAALAYAQLGDQGAAQRHARVALRDKTLATAGRDRLTPLANAP